MPGAHFRCCRAKADGRCPTLIIGYRSCPVPGCKVEVGFCAPCGGPRGADASAVAVVRDHMRLQHPGSWHPMPELDALPIPDASLAPTAAPQT